MARTRLWWGEDIDEMNNMLLIEREGFQRKKGAVEAVAKFFGLEPDTMNALLCRARKNPENYPYRVNN